MMTGLRPLFRELKFTVANWRGNFWFIPVVMGVFFFGLFILTIYVDRRVSDGTIYVPSLPFWFSASPEAARDLMGTIASAIGTITTVVFSISILTLQLASSEYTPRLLRGFTKSAVSQTTLGTFVTTVWFSILTLSMVRAEQPDVTPFVPDFAVNIAKLLALASLALLVFFIGHIAILISPSRIIRSTHKHTMKAYRNYIQDKIGNDAEPLVPTSGEVVYTVYSKDHGYLQSIRLAKLETAANGLADDGAEVRVIVRVAVGDFVKKSDTLAEVEREHPPTEKTFDDLRGAFVLGQARLPETDFRFGIDELASMALRRIRQLDPDTADECTDALVETWLDMMNEPLYPPNRWLRAGDRSIYLTLLPVDVDTQLAEALRTIMRHALEEGRLLGLASSVVEGVTTVVRESTKRDKTETFGKCWPLLIWTTCRLIENTGNEEIMRRIVAAVKPVRSVVEREHPNLWAGFDEKLRRLYLDLNREPLKALWEDQ